MLNKSGESGHPYVSFQPFIIEYDVSFRLVIYGLYYVKVCPRSIKSEFFRGLCRWAELLAGISAQECRNTLSQDLSTSCFVSPGSLLYLSDPQWSSSANVPSGSHEVTLEWASWKASFNARGAGCPLGLFFPPCKNHRPRGALFVQHCAGLKKG